MLADLDASLVAWLARFVPGVQITLAPPPEPTVAASGSRGKDKSAALMLFLSQLHEDVDAGVPTWTDVRDQEGVVLGRRSPVRSYRLTYLLVAFAADPMAEHEVLGRLLAGCMTEAVLPESVLQGQMVDSEEPVMVRLAPSVPVVDTRDLWSAWGIRPRAVLELSVLAQMPISALYEVAPPPAGIDMGVARVPTNPGQEDKPVPSRRPTNRVTD